VLAVKWRVARHGVIVEFRECNCLCPGKLGRSVLRPYKDTRR